VRIGVARDAAFSFYYEDNLELLVEAGAELVPFSPLGDATLPAVDGLYLGGGYPELHAEALAANAPMRAAIRAFHGPVYAERGGLMFLGETLDDRPMCGVLPVTTRMGGKLRALGYRWGAGPEGWSVGQVLGSYVHAHFGSNPAIADAFVAACRTPSRRSTGGDGAGFGGRCGGRSPPPQEDPPSTRDHLK